LGPHRHFQRLRSKVGPRPQFGRSPFENTRAEVQMIDSAREAKPNRETTARQKQSETRRAARQTEEAQSEQAGQTNTETKQERRRSKEKEDRYKGNASCKRGGEQLLPSPDKCVSPQSPGVRFEWKVFHPRASLDVRWWQPVYFGRSGRGRGGALGLNA